MYPEKHPGAPAGRPLARLSIALGLTVAATGCATYDSTRQSVAQAVDHWQRPTARLDSAPADDSESENGRRAVSAAVSGASHTGPVSSVASRPADPYIREALAHNPGIRSAIAEARARLERIPQVMALPDPVIRSVVRPEPIQTAAGDVYFTLGISQTFPMLAKLEQAGHIAAAETRIALEHLNTRRVQLVADVERAYWQTYRLDRYLEITRENLQLLGDMERVVSTQYQVGRVQQQDLLRVQTELAKLRDDAHRFAIQRTSAAAALNQLCDKPPEREVPFTEAVDVPAAQADIDQLIALAAEHNPELAALREQIARDREQVELARLGYWPDLTLGFEWNYLRGRRPFIPPINPQTGRRPPYNRKSADGTDNWAILLQMNIPLWADRVEAAKREARQRLLASQSELRATRNRVAFRVFDAWSRVEAQQHTLDVLDAELIPQAKQTYEVTLTAYQAGQTDFVTLIDNWRRWLDFELMRHREAVDLETALADMQRQVGMQLLADAAEREVKDE